MSDCLHLSRDIRAGQFSNETAVSRGIIIDLISEKVADLCGYKPQQDLVSAFLLEQLIMPPELSEILPIRPQKILPPQRTSQIGYTLHGKTTHLRSAVDR